jgi:hypothetical protein
MGTNMIAPVLQPLFGTAHLFQDGFVGAKSGFVGNPDKPSRWRAKLAALLQSACFDLPRFPAPNGGAWSGRWLKSSAPYPVFRGVKDAPNALISTTTS